MPITSDIPAEVSKRSPPGTKGTYAFCLSTDQALSIPLGNTYAASSARRLESSTKSDREVVNPVNHLSHELMSIRENQLGT